MLRSLTFALAFTSLIVALQVVGRVMGAAVSGPVALVNRATKRLFDITMSAVLLALFSPVLVVIALVIKLTSPGPVFYRATRIGRHGQTFRLYKFRSMVVDADRRGPGITTAGDSRITPIGRILRKTKLDELPQFLNVLQGDMSLVGPRPEDPRYVALYTPEQRIVLGVRPGITSPASVYYRDEEALLSGADWERQYVEEIMPAKLEIDLNYVQRGGVLADLTIMWRTFRLMWEPLLQRETA